MYSDNDILFPHSVISSMRDVRNGTWSGIVDEVTDKPETSAETLGFMSLMIDINGCLDCETDSFRAMRGCGNCARQALRRCKFSDDELAQKYAARVERMRALGLDE